MERITLILEPEPDTPADIPFRWPSVDVPLHPAARRVDAEPFVGMGFPSHMYRSGAEALVYALPLAMQDAFEWFKKVLSDEGYSPHVMTGRSGNRLTGKFTEWIVLDVSPIEGSDLIVQLTFRPYESGGSLVTYRAEEHPTPIRDPHSYVSEATERIEVEYTFLNGPEHTVHRTVTEPAAVRSVVDAINSLPRDKRAVGGSTFWPGGWADLHVMGPGATERKVRVDASYRVVFVDSSPPLSGNLWRLLIQVAPPPKGASGIPNMDWEKDL